MAYKRAQKRTVAKKPRTRKYEPVIVNVEENVIDNPKRGSSPVTVFGLMFTLLIAIQSSLFGFVSIPKAEAAKEEPKLAQTVVTPETVTAKTPVAETTKQEIVKPIVSPKKRKAAHI